MANALPIEYLLDDAAALIQEGKLLHAAQLYRRVTLAEPSVEQAWIRLAQIYVSGGQPVAAERILLEGLRHVERSGNLFALLGGLHLRCGRHGQALVYFKRALSVESELTDDARAQLHFSVALVYLRRGHVQLAEYHLRRTRRLDPHFPRVHETLGEVLLRRAALSEAIPVLRTALQVDPYSWYGHYLLGNALARRRLWKSAYDEFALAVDMGPDEPLSWLMCGEMLLHLDRLDEAERYLNKALQLDPEMSEAAADIGLVCTRRGDRERALEYFDRALSLEPDNRKALRGKLELTAVSPPQRF
jgi:tetratricopeptide (TPR) repeat protein